MPVVVCNNVIKIHKQGALEVVALQGLDFVMEQGEFVAMVGPSGAGKSSLLQILAGIDTPSAGEVAVDSYSLSEAEFTGVDHFRRGVGLVWQDYTRNLIPYLTLRANVELPMLLAGVARRRRLDRTNELLAATRIEALATRYSGQLSGGEQQRAALCVALSLGPKLLLADEPTGELDSEHSLDVFELLATLCHQGGLTVLVATHDAVLASRADRVVHLEDGRLIDERSAAEGARGLAVDEIGRVRIPRRLLDEAGIEDRASAEVEGDRVVLKRDDVD